MTDQRTVLVSGGSGLIGAHVVRELLESGYRVRVLARGKTTARSLDGLDVERVQGDVDDRDALGRALSGCRAFVHCASPYPMLSLRRRASVEAARRHIDGVIEAVRASGVPRLVYTSTIGTVGSTARPGGPFTEEDALPDTIPATYHRMKVVMERRVLDEAAAGLPAVVVNPSMVLGAYDSKPKRFHLLANVGSGKLPLYLRGNINAISGRKTARGHRLALERGHLGARYILGGENTTFAEIFGRIARAAGVKPPSVALPLPLASFAAGTTELASLLFGGKGPPLFPLTTVHEVRYSGHYDTSLSERELGLSAGDDLDSAIREGLEWARSLGYL
jgi:dihydroflavonol-4-reductase